MKNNKPLSNDVLEMALERKNYDPIIEMVCAAEGPETRWAMISQLAYRNPYLSAKIVMTTSSNQEEEKRDLLKIINNRLQEVSNIFSRQLLLLSLLELEEDEGFKTADKYGADLADIKTVRYFITRLNLKQQMVFIRFMAGYHDGAGVRNAVNIMLNRCDGWIPPEEENRADVVETAKILLISRKPDCTYKLLKAVGIRGNFSQALGMSDEELIDAIMRGGPLLAEDAAEFLFNVKYGLKIETVNDRDAWTLIYQNSMGVMPASIDGLVRKYARHDVFSKETLLHILKLRGVSEDECNKCLTSKSSMMSRLTGDCRDTIYKRPFYPIMQDEKKIISLLDDENFESIYRFSEDRRLDLNTNKKVAEDEREYFDYCAQNFSSARNLVRVYFNTPLKYAVNLEYLIKTIMERFQYGETDVKYLLRDYTFRGKVCRLNEKSVSVRAFNVWTSLSCRLNRRKCIGGEESQCLRLNQMIYFKFDYLEANSGKINVCLPAVSLERVRELEARTPEFAD